MRFLSLAAASAALASIAAANNCQPHHASGVLSPKFVQAQQVIQEAASINVKDAPTFNGWSSVIIGTLGIAALSGPEPSHVLKHAAQPLSTLLAYLEPSRLFDQAKFIANGLSHGATLYTAKSVSKSSVRRGMLRRQPRTPVVLVSSLAGLGNMCPTCPPVRPLQPGHGHVTCPCPSSSGWTACPCPALGVRTWTWTGYMSAEGCPDMV